MIHHGHSNLDEGGRIVDGRKSRVGPQARVLLTSAAGQTAPGLEVLGETSRLYALEQSGGGGGIRSLNPALKIRKYFTIVDDRGDHLFSVGEVRNMLFSAWQACMHVCSPQGDPVMMIYERETGPFGRGYTDPATASLCYEADRRLLNSRNSGHKVRGERELEIPRIPSEPNSSVHVVDSLGNFLGHYVGEQMESVDVLDSKLTTILRLQPPDINSFVYPEQSKKNNVDTDRRLPTQLLREMELYHIIDGSANVGAIHGCIPPGGSRVSSTAPVFAGLSATFPQDFTQVDKALILGFLLYKQRTISLRGSILCGVIFVTICSILLLTLCGLVLGVLFRFDRLN